MTVIAIGMTIGISFLIKPSSIIYIISWTIVELIKKIKDSHFSFENIVVICLIIGSISLPIATFNSFINNQKIIQIDSNKAMPWTHFVMMGLKGNGGYNFNDVERDKKIIDPTLRKKSNVEEIKRRLAEYKVTGYVQFLTQKHFNNSDRGDFGWGKDGTPQIPETKSKNWFQTFLRDLYYQQGKKTNILRFYMQIIWIVIIFGLFFTFKSNLNSNLLSYIKLTIIGAFVYLLLFEGGRSRYLIQYLPFILILSSIGLAKFSIKDTRKMKWFVKEKNDF